MNNSDKIIPEEVPGGGAVTVFDDQFTATGNLLGWEPDDDGILSPASLSAGFALSAASGNLTLYSGTDNSLLGKMYKSVFFESGVTYTLSVDYSSSAGSVSLIGAFDSNGNLLYDGLSPGANSFSFTGNGLPGYIGFMVQPKGIATYDNIKLTYTSPSTTTFLADIRQSTDYSPFGVILNKRDFRLTDPVTNDLVVRGRYGFNGMEKDDEIKGSGNSYDFGARMYDPRVGRWLTIDPLTGKQPSFSPYKAFLNSPIIFKDPDGEDEYLVILIKNEKTGAQLRLAVPEPISNRLRAGNIREAANSTNIYETQNYYDYKTVVTITIGADGKTSEDIKQYTLTNSKRYTKTMFSSIVNGVRTGTVVDPDGWDLEGKGGTQRGGGNYTSKSGGASPTKQKANSNVKTTPMDELLDYAGAAGRSLSKVSPDWWKNGMDWAELVGRAKSIIEESGFTPSPDPVVAPGEKPLRDSMVVMEPSDSGKKDHYRQSTQKRSDAMQYDGKVVRGKKGVTPDTMYVGK